MPYFNSICHNFTPPFENTPIIPLRIAINIMTASIRCQSFFGLIYVLFLIRLAQERCQQRLYLVDPKWLVKEAVSLLRKNLVARIGSRTTSPHHPRHFRVLAFD